jgi:hypothetical protein
MVLSLSLAAAVYFWLSYMVDGSHPSQTAILLAGATVVSVSGLVTGLFVRQGDHRLTSEELQQRLQERVGTYAPPELTPVRPPSPWEGARAQHLTYRPKLTNLGCVSVALGLALLGNLWVRSPGLAASVTAGLLLVRLARSLSHWRHLRGHQVLVEGAELIQLDPRGEQVARVSLEEPIVYEYLDRSFNNAIYQLWQGDAVLRFTSNAENAPTIVSEVLGLPWPVRDAAWRDQY